MSSKSPKEIFEAFKHTTTLEEIASAKGLDFDENPSKKKLVSLLSSTVSSSGLHLLLKTLKLKTLQSLASHIEWDDIKVPSGKGMIAKRIFEAIEDKPAKFFDKLEKATLKDILEELDVELPEKKEKKAFVDEILGTADSFGLEHYFSSFSMKKLKEFTESCNLTVETGSLQVMLECLLNQENHEATKKKKPVTVIDKNAKKADLHTLLKNDLVTYCDTNSLDKVGNKKELVDRIWAFLHDEGSGDEEKSKKSEKGNSDKSTKSDKSDKSEKSEKDEKPSKSSKTDKQSEKSKEADKSSKSEKSEKAKSEKEKAEKEKNEKEKDKKGEKGEKDKKAEIEKEKDKKGEKSEKEKSEKKNDKMDKEKTEKEKKAEKAEKDKKLEKDKMDKEKTEKDKKTEKEKKAEKEKAEKEKAEKEKAEKEKTEKEKKAEKEKSEKEKAEKDKKVITKSEKKTEKSEDASSDKSGED